MNYQKINTIGGWALFLIATIVYVMTLEPTTSLWDCGEYIATSYKLEVGHPPGAPLFMMLGRMFSWFVSTDNVAYMVNLMSALSSSLTIMFLFWSITALGRKVATIKGEDFDTGKMIAVLGSGFIGALSYTFTDSFWFSAVEAEVYAMSSFFTAIVFWAILKWERVADEPDSDRWIILIMFLIGLSIGVHLLNLLAIPAIAFLFYYKKYKTTTNGIIITALVGIGVLGIIQALIIPGLVDLGEFFERTFVNTLGMPFFSGTVFYFLLIAAIIGVAIRLSHVYKNQWVYRSAMGLGMIIIGYSCFAMITIRSNANPPIDENNPEDFVTLSSYLKREQYGTWPIVYGQYYNAALEEYGDKSPKHARRWVVKVGDEDKKGFVRKDSAESYASNFANTEIVEKYYEIDDGKGQVPIWNSDQMTFLPRMWSSNGAKWPGYEYWSGHDNNTGDPINYNPNRGIKSKQTVPTMSENLTYMFSYQYNWMYFRYFFWNFAGRQNDEQGTRGNPLDGNWLSGVSFIDSERLGDQSNVPESITSNPAYNKFYMIPLILGLIGFIFHLYRSPKDWSVVLLLFLFTGMAIVFYLNQQPDEPRERDYAYAASFYAFAIWIGLSVYALYYAAKELTFNQLGRLLAYCGGTGVVFLLFEFMAGNSHAFSYSIIYITAVMGILGAIMIGLKNALGKPAAMAGLAVLLTLPSPLLLAIQGWDDHDRSNRYTAEALAHNYLTACMDNGIVFTSGDNDTFPLWYIQEVEGFKTSVRVCNLSLLHSDWYVEQMARKAYDSEALPIQFTKDQYASNYLERVYLGNQPTAYFQKKYEANQDLIDEVFPKMVNFVAQAVQGSKLAQNQPAVVDTIKGFAKTKTYADFLPFLNKLLSSNQVAQPIKKQIKDAQSQFHKSWDYLPLDFALDLLRDESNLQISPNGKDKYFVIPSRKFVVDVDKEALIASGQVPEGLEDQIADKMRFEIKSGSLTRSELMVLEMIAQNKDWSRPIYFGSRASRDTYLGLDKYFQLEGLVYHLVPLEQSMDRASRYFYGSIDRDKMYTNLMENFEWGNMNQDGVLVDYYNRRQINHYRLQFLFLARSLMDQNDIERTQDVLDRAFEVMPLSNVPIDYNDYATDQIIATYFLAAEKAKDESVRQQLIDKGIELAKHSIERSRQNILYYTTLGDYDLIRRTFSRMRSDWEAVNLYHDIAVSNAKVNEILPEGFVTELTTAKNDIDNMMMERFSEMQQYYQEHSADNPEVYQSFVKSVSKNFGALYDNGEEQKQKPQKPANVPTPTPVDTAKP